MIAHAKANAAKSAAVRAANRTAGKAVKPTYRRPPRDGGWVGCNDILPCCSSVAAANSLYAVTGWRVADDDVYALHFAAGGTAETGVGLLRVMETLTDHGLAGVRISGADLVDAFPHGAVAGVLVPGWQWHALAAVREPSRDLAETYVSAASWGTLLDGEVLDYAWEVWALDWLASHSLRLRSGRAMNVAFCQPCSVPGAWSGATT